MEKNTINLSVEDYNEMRDFNEAFKKDNAVSVFLGWDGYESTIYTKNEALKKVTQANVNLKLKIDELKSPEKKQPSYDEIKKMSWWQFRKWKRGI